MKSSTMKYSNKMTSINTSMGNISIDNEAIAQYAGSVAMYGRNQHEGWSCEAS